MLNESKHKYLCHSAFINVFYQCIKIFYLSRVNIKSLTQKALAGDKINIPKHYLSPKSNLMSDSEIILIYWMEYCL